VNLRLIQAEEKKMKSFSEFKKKIKLFRSMKIKLKQNVCKGDFKLVQK